jgi:acyl-CoA reductase-like NAD-dependent aldehyde dehydrogenase
MIIDLMNEILPPGVINICTGEGGLGRKITGHPDIAKIVFTGSTPTGINIMQNAAPTMKRLTLELGGNDAAIVLDDVDLDKCTDNIFARIFGNSGQTCAALKRLYVHESVHDELVARLVEKVKAAKVGAWDEEGAQFGPVQNKDQFDFVMELIEDTKAKGGNFVVGGNAMDRPGYFIELSIATDVTDGMRIVDEEPFGPIVPVIKFTDTEDALRRANANENGLGASVWTRDEAKGIKLAQRMESGTAWVNQHSQQMPFTPFGGAKMSGIGVEHGLHGLMHYTQLQTLHVNRKGGLM